MFRRITRSLSVLVALLVAYQAYVLLAVPVMEPPIEARQNRRATRQEREEAAQAVTRYQLLLANYFPPDHWSQQRPPKVFASSNEQAMLVLNDYTRHAEARASSEPYTLVDITSFALLIFPTPPREGITPPRDTIILEAPQGARLKFDEFRPELGRIGQIIGGQFPGRITIRSDMHEEGPADDLIVETADLEMNTKLLYSSNPVRFRLGANVGGGRELEIRFLADEHVQPRSSDLKLAGVDTLEIRRDLKMRLQLETESLLPGDDSHSRAEHGDETQAKPAEKPPLEVTCSGPFTFDFVRYVAGLDRDVEVRQIKTDGPSDQLFCSHLDIYFTPKAIASEENRPVVLDPGKRQQRDLGRLEPTTVVAQGHPVVVVSPERQAQARGDKIQIALRDQRVKIAGAHDAMLVYGANVVRAPLIDYTHPRRDAGTPIGRFHATGPGTLHYVADPTKPDQVFQAAWQTSVSLDRQQGQPVLTLDGRPQLAFAHAGSLTADRMTIYLRELQPEAPAGLGIAIAGAAEIGEKLRVSPDRLIAEGRVDIHSAQLTGRTGQLLVTFQTQLEPGQEEGSGGGDASQRVAGGLTDPSAGSRQTFHVDADRMQMEVKLSGQSAAPETLACTGNIVLREVQLVAAEEQPLEIRGGHMTVDRMSSPSPYVTLRGTAPGEAPGSKLAQLAGRGMTMLVDTIELDGGSYRTHSDGPGKARLLVTRDLNGQESATPFPLEITWQGGLEFDGDRSITFHRGVAITGADDVLRCDQVVAKLSAPIVPANGLAQASLDLSEIDCSGGVAIDHVTRDQIGVTSHERMALERLHINQQTGAVSGEGPGVIRSTRFGNGLDALAGKPPGAAPAAAAPPPGSPGSKLYFLRVDFRSGLTGNLYTREMTFHDDVRAVYGPVDAWEQELDASRPEILPPEAMTLTCDEMRINEDPVAGRLGSSNPQPENQPIGFIQLQATGDVRIEGQSPPHGAFSARAATASYDQAKDAFILQGDGRTPATLWREGQQGAPPAAGWIRYLRKTGEISVDNFQYLEITPQDIENARRTNSVR